MDKKNCERLFETPEHSTNKSNGSKWRELPISNCREIKGIPYSETESFAETVQEARTKKEFPSIYVKSYSHNTKQLIKSFMARVSVAMSPSKLPNITKKNVTEIKFTVAEKRAEKMTIFQG
ncbi:8457_t:CDS:2, partial [Rhizophagus irregularis]